MMMKFRTQSLLFFFFFFVLFSSCFTGLIFCQQQCSNAFTKVTVCLNYASGKADSPSDQCCSAVKDIKNTNPICLCLIIQQTHHGLPALKSMGLQEAKLIQLPSACKLANASLSDCPKLLSLSPGSSDYAIFTNNTSSSATTNTPVSTTSMPKDDKSVGFMHGPKLLGPIAILVLISVFPMGLSLF